MNLCRDGDLEPVGERTMTAADTSCVPVPFADPQLPRPPRYHPRRGGGTMRRLLRWTFNALATASLLLCLATAGLWVRSYRVCDELWARREARSAWGPGFKA